MDMEDHQARIWLASYHTITDEAAKAAFVSSTISFNDKKLARLQRYLKKTKLSWKALIIASYCLTIHRLSSSKKIHFHWAKGQVSHASLNIKDKPQVITNEITAELTKNDFMQAIQSSLEQFDKSKIKNKSVIDELYWIVFRTTAHDKKKNEKNFSVETLTLSLGKNLSDEIILHYHPKVFSKNAINSITKHFKVILKELCKSANTPVTQLNILSKREREEILNTWHQPRYPFSKANIQSCVHELVQQHAKQQSDALAAQDEFRSITYAQLDAMSDIFATHLIERGVNIGDSVCVFISRSIDLVVLIMAIFKAGAVFVPINPKYPIERIEFVLSDTRVNYILTDEKSHLPDAFKHLAWHIELNHFHQKIEGINLPTANADRVAYIIYTSGTTGKPKGICITHANLNNLVNWYADCFNINKNDIVSQFASQGFDSYFCEVIPSLALGAKIAIVDDNIKLSPTLFFEWLHNEKITVCDLPTSYAQILLLQSIPDTLSLRLIKIGGEAITAHLSTLFKFDLWNTYGPTEATVEATYYKIYDAKTKTYTAYTCPSPPIGKPLAGASVYVVDEYLMPVAMSVPGELLIGGKGLATGYINRLDLTEKKFIADPVNSTSNERYYRTGDLVKWLKDGNLEFVGRIDNQVKIRGYRIELGDIENAIAEHPDVSEVLVQARENINGEKSLIAYVVPNLDRERFLFQERCYISDENDQNFVEAISENISRHGIAISGIMASFDIGKKYLVHIKLPGFNETKKLSARLVWQKDMRCGFVFDLNPAEQEVINKSIEYFISKNNLMELVLSASAKRSLKKALQLKLPEYMIPQQFVTSLQLPLNLNGKIDIHALPKPDEFEKRISETYIAPKTETEIKLCQIWTTLLQKNQISMGDNFFDIGGNSLLAAQLSIEISNRFDITIPVNILFDLSYIPILSEYIDNKGASYTKESDIQREIQSDLILPEQIQPLKNLPKLKAPKNILLTGAGGYLGIFMLRDLLINTDATIYCLIRQGEFSTAAKRLMQTAEKFGLNHEISLTNRRIIAISSDLSFDKLGLPEEQYHALANKIDLIIHCGAQVNIMASYQKLKGSNVTGTLEIMKFATTGKDKPIHYISTLSSAYLKDAAGALTESYPTSTFENLFGGYAITKWVSEYLLLQMKERGLPVSIYRSGYIFGDSASGILSLNDALLMLIKGCIQLGYAPTLQERITLLPVDFVSRAINAIVCADPTASDVYHIDHPTGLMWSDLVAWYNHHGYNMKLISLTEWKNKLKTIGRDNALFPFLPYYLSLQEDYSSAPVSTEKARQRLEALHLEYPEINDKLLLVYLRYMQEQAFLPNTVTAPQ